jgi:hypothetical protein
MGLACLKGAASEMEIVNACGLLAWQALGAGPSRVEIIQACAGLRGAAWLIGDCAGLCRP